MDHPHAYGDKPSSNRSVVREKGSSPRVWGQETHMTEYVFPIGIIPTRMGTSRKYAKNHKQQKDHPHAYGDKVMILLLTVLALGSSPRVWGQEAPLLVCNDNIRIIPTRMGTSLLFCVEVFNLEDHPHAYGDKVFQVFLSSPKEGSSPRVWGQVQVRCTDMGHLRIIPTRMGTRIKFKEMDFNI